MRTLILITLIALSNGPAIAVEDAGSANATVTMDVIQCPQDKDIAPGIQIADASLYPNLKYEAENADVAKIAQGLFELKFQTQLRNVFVRVSSPNCSNVAQFGTLPGHGRAVSIALFRRVANLHAFQNAVMGTIPVTPGAAFIVFADGSTRVLDIQEGVYYIERVPPGKYKLRFELHGGFQSDVPIDLTMISNKEAIRDDVTLEAFRDHLGEILLKGDTEQRCLWCYKLPQPSRSAKPITPPEKALEEVKRPGLTTST